MVRPWKKESSRELESYRIFSLALERHVSPRTGHALDAVIVKAENWVNVVAFTPDERCVMIRQYRFGAEAVTLEIPGGIIDPGESPLVAAQRELREETGYAAREWIALGSIAPNPAFERNRLYTFLALSAERVGEQEQDTGEDIEVTLVERARLPALLAAGEVDHALVVVAFQKLALHEQGFVVR